eukprot:13095825-Alexandrium_andersonii.AAC.1
MLRSVVHHRCSLERGRHRMLRSAVHQEARWSVAATECSGAWPPRRPIGAWSPQNAQSVVHHRGSLERGRHEMLRSV